MTPADIIAVLGPLPVLLPVVGAGLTLALSRSPALQRTISIATLTLVLCIALVLVTVVDQNGAQAVIVGGWIPPLGIVLVVDRLAVLMVTVSSTVTLGVLVYSVGQGNADGDEETPVSIFHPTYLILTAGVANAFLAGDLFNLYVGFEILLVASYVLLTLGGTDARIRAGTTYVVVSLLSSVLFLSAVALIYGATGTVNMAQLAERIPALPADTEVLLHVVLLVAFGIKAAVFPLAFWLPDSYPTAPAPVTAVFAGLLTKVGVYAIIRTETLLFQRDQLTGILMVAALLTLLVAIFGAIVQPDLKRMLSFTLVSHIGYMIFGVAMSTVAGLAGAIFYTIHHITIQTALFLACGLVERRGGTTSVRRLGGLARLSPVLGLLFFVPAMNLAGIPPFSGFIGKLGLFRAGVDTGGWLPYTLVGAGALVSLLTLYAMARVWNVAFWRSPDEAEEPDPALYAARSTDVLPRTMVGATTAMVTVGIALAVAAGPLWSVTTRAATDILEPSVYIETVLR